ncbi:Uncharacterised protein [Vibrio cholerae]|nr:Uncharacterised protein [Vibrio cholerae]CSD16835.1 Uncharacterised protein [Vibrio cholerae]
MVNIFGGDAPGFAMHHAFTAQIAQRQFIAINAFNAGGKVAVFINHILVEEGWIEWCTIQLMEGFATERVARDIFHAVPKTTGTSLKALGQILNIINQLVGAVVFHIQHACTFGAQTHVDVFSHQHHGAWCTLSLQVKHGIEDPVIALFIGKGFDGFIQFIIGEDRDGSCCALLLRKRDPFGDFFGSGIVE